MARVGDDAVRALIRADTRVASQLAETAAQSAAAAVRSGATTASKAAAKRALSTPLKNINPTTLAQSTDDAARLVSNQKSALKNENPAATVTAEKNAIDAASSRVAGGENLVKSKFNVSPTTLLAGVAAGASMTYVLTKWLTTDGKTITITNVKRLDSQRVQISYNPPSILGFSISVNDTLDFSGCSSSRCTIPALSNGERVDSLIDDHNLIILKSIADPYASSTQGVSAVQQVSNSLAGSPSTPSGTPSSTSPSGSPIPAPATLSGSWGSAVVHSSFSNQFIAGVSDTAGVVFDSAAEVVDAGLNAAAPVAANAATQAGNVAAAGLNALGPVAAAAGGAAKGAFCSIVPFVCDTTFLWICAALCILLIVGGGAFMLISKKK